MKDVERAFGPSVDHAFSKAEMTLCRTSSRALMDHRQSAGGIDAGSTLIYVIGDAIEPDSQAGLAAALDLYTNALKRAPGAKARLQRELRQRLDKHLWILAQLGPTLLGLPKEASTRSVYEGLLIELWEARLQSVSTTMHREVDQRFRGLTSEPPPSFFQRNPWWEKAGIALVSAIAGALARTWIGP